MIINLKNNIYIEGFNSDLILQLKNKKSIIYKGMTSDIPESLATTVLDWMFWDERIERKRYKNYNEPVIVAFPYIDYKDSIKSACNKPYCVIYKR